MIRVSGFSGYPALEAPLVARLVECLPVFRRPSASAAPSVAAARALAYLLLRRELGFSPDFTYNSAGKPAVAGERAREVSFSISHSKTVVAVAVRRGGGAVGFDLEDRITSPRRERAAARIFSGGERRRMDRATKFWTLKESQLKCAGCGFAGGASERAFDFSPWADSEIFTLGGMWFFSRDAGAFHFSVCAASPFSSLSVSWLDDARPLLAPPETATLLGNAD
ncbi:MAG: 4'-phosphopantetheinyl transferase superfamily protein [Spirochaetaceae bacterium]|nr:4'-phosphopantetheinyl transferase superfamily protein [Spirochaetaceae bacterium]